ncbi:MAG: molybdopterin-dependent oxidoreductase [Proteobacteria bacterium]|nr:molybdopterin-dependent oxidoreductase [Pseudomonadota bacterium]
MTITKTTCRFCLVKCGMLVETRNGKVTGIRGDKDHPLSKGYLCIKGTSSLDVNNSSKRIIYPQKRVGERGSGKWKRVDWDEAIEDIAERMKKIISDYGSKTIAVQALPPKEYFAYDLFLHSIKSPTFFKHDSHQCFTPQLMSDILTFGALATYPTFTTLPDTDVVVLWGINMSETNGSKHRRVRDAQKKGSKTIVVDPRPTLSAKQADIWLRLRPGTDAALALGLMHEIVKHGWYDKDFIKNWTLGFEDLEALIAEYDLERVSKITWVPAKKIKEAAQLFGQAQDACLFTFIGATMAGNSIATLRLMGFLPILKGKIDQAGNNLFQTRTDVRMPGYYGPDLGVGDPPDYSEQLSAGKFPLLAGPNAITSPYPHPKQVIDAMLTGVPYPVKALWTSCNPVIGLEDSMMTIKALKTLDLLIVSDLFASPTAQLADYILPMTTHLESNAITEYAGMSLVAARVRAVKPLGEAREEADPVLDIANRLGLANQISINNNRDLLDHRLSPLGINFDEFAEQGYVYIKHEPLKHENGKLRPDGQNGFNTPSGKIEFTSEKLKEFGYDSLPDYVEPPYSPISSPEIATEFPLVCITGTRSIEYYSTLGIEVTPLRKKRPWPSLEIAPETARKYQLTENDWVVIDTPDAPHSIKRKVCILPELHPDVINVEGLWYMPGSEDILESVKEVGTNILTPLRDDVDPVCGGSIARCVMAKIAKTETPQQASNSC